MAPPGRSRRRTFCIARSVPVDDVGGVPDVTSSTRSVSTSESLPPPSPGDSTRLARESSSRPARSPVLPSVSVPLISSPGPQIVGGEDRRALARVRQRERAAGRGGPLDVRRVVGRERAGRRGGEAEHGRDDQPDEVGPRRISRPRSGAVEDLDRDVEGEEVVGVAGPGRPDVTTCVYEAVAGGKPGVQVMSSSSETCWPGARVTVALRSASSCAGSRAAVSGDRPVAGSSRAGRAG